MNIDAVESRKTLLQTIEAMAESAPAEGFSLREIFDQLDESAFGAGLFLLALPCCIPFLYGVPQVVSLPMMALAMQMVMGRERPWMPEKMAGRRIDKAGLTKMSAGGRKWLGWVEKIVRPRLSGITGKRSERIIGAFLVVFCASILLPIPMTNTVPGFGVAIASFGLMQKDGLMVLGGLAIGLAWISALIGALVFGVGFLAG